MGCVFAAKLNNAHFQSFYQRETTQNRAALLTTTTYQRTFVCLLQHTPYTRLLLLPTLPARSSRSLMKIKFLYAMHCSRSMSRLICMRLPTLAPSLIQNSNYFTCCTARKSYGARLATARQFFIYSFIYAPSILCARTHKILKFFSKVAVPR